MFFKTVIKYGLPFSFVYCTIYQQDIWREVDERLVEEQKSTWKKFFNLIDDGYHAAVLKLNLSTQPIEKRITFVSKLESMDVKECWNNKVQNTFDTIDKVVSNPSIIACKVYRKIQPLITAQDSKTKTEKSD